METTIHVGVVYALRPKAHYGVFPLRVFRGEIQACGLTLAFVNRLQDPALNRCAVVCVVFSDRYALIEGTTDKEAQRERFIQALHGYRAAGQKVILIDDHDTSGGINPRFVEAADLYAKAQLLKDRSLYQQPLYQRVYFKDYYHRRFGVVDEEPVYSQPLPADLLPRLALGWNYGLIDWNIHNVNRLRQQFRMRLPHRHYHVKACRTPLTERTITASLRVGLHQQDATVHFHRQQALDRLALLDGQYNLRYKGRVPAGEYRRELCDSVIAPSPYGIGEVCYRDFEAFKNGAVLLKPDMGNIDTWPDYYRPDETYVPYALDYDDFTAKIETIMSDLPRYQAVATQGQARWLDSLQQAEAFAEHFYDLVRQVQR